MCKQNFAKHVLSWNEIDYCILLLRDALRDRQFDEIVGISRAGLVASVLLAHALDMRSMSVLELQITNDDTINAKKFDEVKVVRLPCPTRIQGRRILLADDIVGSGRTMAKAQELLINQLGAAHLTRCSLVVNEANLSVPLDTVCDFVGVRVKGWTVFPWEYKKNTNGLADA